MISPLDSGPAGRAAFNPATVSPRDIKRLPAGDQVAAAAGQFEAILLRQFLQESVGKIMGGQSAGAQGGVYGYMLTDILASKLTAAGGLGLGRMLQHQLAPAPRPGAPTELSR